MAGLDAFTKILLHFDGSDASTTITESGPLAHTWTANGNAQLDTGITKFGSATLLCDGTGDYVSTPDSADFDLGSSDFTIDGWFNVAGGAGATRRLYGQNNSGLGDFSIRGNLTTGNALQCQVSSDGTASTSITSTTTFTTTGWHHFAFVRTGNILRLFINGVQEGGDVAFAVPVFASASIFAVGRSGATTANTWNGSIDEFRLSVGIARWTSNFTPPTAAYDSTVIGAATITLSQTGNLKGAGALAGTGPITLSQTGLLRGAGQLFGSTSLTFSQTGTVIGLVALSGSTTVTFTQSGAVLGSGRLLGSTAVTFGQTGSLFGSGILLGTATLVFGQSGVLGGMVPISGTTTFTFGQIGNLTGAYAQQHFHLYPSESQAGHLTPGLSLAGSLKPSSSLAGVLRPATSRPGRIAITTSKAGHIVPETVQ